MKKNLFNALFYFRDMTSLQFKLSIAIVILIGLVACSTPANLAVEPTLQPTPTWVGLDITSTAVSIHSLTVTPTPTRTTTPTPKPLFVSTPISFTHDVISANNAKDLITLANWGRGKANYITYSPDGTTLAIAASTGIYFYDAKTLADKSHIVMTDVVSGIAFSPNSALLAVTFRKGAVQLWQAADGMLLQTFERAAGTTSGSPVFSSDGLFLVSGSGDRAVRLWRVSDGKLMHTFRGYIDTRGGYSGNEENRSTIALSADGSLLATTDIYFHDVWIWQTSNGALLQTLKGNSLAFSDDGTLLAVGRGDDFISPAFVEVWRVSDWSLQYTLDERTNPVSLLKFSSDNKILMTNDRLWDMGNGNLLKDLHAPDRDRFVSLAFSPDNTAIASISRNCRIQVRQISNLENPASLFGYMNGARRVTFSPNGTLLATGDDWAVQIWRVSDGALLLNIDHGTEVQQLVFSPDGKILASGNLINGLRLWDVETGALLKSLKSSNYLDSIDGLAFSPDGAFLAASGISRGVQIWKVSSGQLISTLDAPYGTLSFSPDGSMLAVGGYQTIQIWRVVDGTLYQTLKRNSYHIASMRFSSDGQSLLVTGDSNTVLWNIQTAKQQDNLILRGNALSPDLAIVSSFYQRDWDHGKIELWRFPEKVLLNSFEIDGFVPDMTFSQNGQYFAAGLADGTMKIWGVKK